MVDTSNGKVFIQLSEIENIDSLFKKSIMGTENLVLSNQLDRYFNSIGEDY